MKYRKLATAVVVAIGALVWMGLDPYAGTNSAPPQFIPGTKLELVGKHGPLQIYIDLTSTNKMPDYAVFEGNECVVLRENTVSNTIETSHFENGFNVLLTKRDKNGKILERMASYDDDLGRMKYTYIDKHGDGLWDCFLDHSRDIFYVRSNLCWVLRNQDDNQRQSGASHPNNP
jgi:hypothetical protein